MQSKIPMTSLIPSTFRAPITDKFIAAFFAKKADTMIQAELEFNESLNTAMLEKAFLLALDAEPILGCRFKKSGKTVIWERLPSDQLVNFTVCGDADEYRMCRNSTIIASQGPALKGYLHKRSDGDVVLFKVAHEAADAAGTKDIVSLVSFLYRQLLKYPDFKPVPNCRSYRSARQLFKWIPKRVLPEIWFNALRELLSLVFWPASSNPFNSHYPLANREFLTITFDASVIRSIKDCGRTIGATLNDIFLALFLRAIHAFDIIPKTTLRCGMTVDLRKWYLPGGKADTVANLSNVEIVQPGKHPGASPIDTIKKVTAITSHRKQHWIGLNLHAGLMNLFRAWSYDQMETAFAKQQMQAERKSAIFPIFTNLGMFESDTVFFNAVPRSACLLAPSGYPPYFGIGMSGYGETITLSTTVYSATKPIVEELMKYMIKEINELSQLHNN